MLLGLWLVKNSYFQSTGFLKSQSAKAVQDVEGHPISWMPYCLVAFLRGRLHKEIVFAEFGSGYFTLFFAERVKSTLSIESAKEWVDKVKEMIGHLPQSNVVFQDIDNGYTTYLADQCQGQKFDLVVVDGRKRVECMINSLDALSDLGVLI